MKIELLADRPGAISTLVELYESTWSAFYVNGPGDASADLEARLNRHQLPAGLIALEGDEVLGAAAIGLDVTTGLQPSVIGLVVVPEHRRRGVAKSLILACEVLAASFGYGRLHIASSVLQGLLSRLGWNRGEKATFLDGSEGAIYSRDLPQAK